MGEGRAVDTVNFSKASDTVCHEILTGKTQDVYTGWVDWELAEQQILGLIISF